jgi:hypothetical protein
MQRLVLGLKRFARQTRDPVPLMLAERLRTNQKQAVILVCSELGNIAIAGEHP